MLVYLGNPKVFSDRYLEDIELAIVLDHAVIAN